MIVACRAYGGLPYVVTPGGTGTSNTLTSPAITSPRFDATTLTWIRPPIAAPINALFFGDSISAEFVSTPAHSPWVDWFMTMPYWTNAIVRSHNFAVSGAFLDNGSGLAGSNTVTNQWSGVSSYLSAGTGTNNVAFFFVGANDYNTATSPSPGVWNAAYESLLAQAKASNCTTVVFTIMPRGTPTNGVESFYWQAYQSRNSLNSRIRWMTNADYIVDTAWGFSDLRTNISNPITLDGVHPNDLGGQRIAALVDYTLRYRPRYDHPGSWSDMQNQLGMMTNFSAYCAPGVSLTNFGGNAMNFQSDAGGDSYIFNTPQATGSRLLFNAGTYGGTGNTWFRYWKGGSSSEMWDGIYNGVFSQFTSLSNNGDYHVKSNIVVGRTVRFVTNALNIPGPITGMGQLATSNLDLYWVTSFKTNLISVGR